MNKLSISTYFSLTILSSCISLIYGCSVTTFAKNEENLQFKTKMFTSELYACDNVYDRANMSLLKIDMPPWIMSSDVDDDDSIDIYTSRLGKGKETANICRTVKDDADNGSNLDAIQKDLNSFVAAFGSKPIVDTKLEEMVKNCDSVIYSYKDCLIAEDVFGK